MPLTCFAIFVVGCAEERGRAPLAAEVKTGPGESMRYQITARTDADIILPRSGSFELDELRVDFGVDERNRLTSVAVSKQVRPDQFEASYGVGPGPGRQISFHVDETVSADVLDALGGIESHLAFASAGALTRFEWQSLRRELIPETAEEGVTGQDLSIEITEGWERETARMGTRDLEYVVQACNTHRESIVPKAFWREAHADYASLRFIQAFYSYYFIIEGYFGNGKTGEGPLLTAFKQSTELQGHVEWLLDAARNDELHWPQMLKLYDEHRCTADVYGTEKLLIRVRGRLHHYSSKSSRSGPTPFSQRQFFTPAWVASGIAHRAILMRDVALGPMPHVHA